MKKRLLILISATLSLLSTTAFGTGEEYAKFQGTGDLNDFKIWVQQRVVYPQSALTAGIEGRVLIQFCIETDGSLSEIKGLPTSSSNKYCDDSTLVAEAIRVIRQSPPWTPFCWYGKPRRQTHILPVDFTIPTKLSIDTTKVYRIADKMPIFKGGDLANFSRWVHERIRRPAIHQCGISSHVILSFIIEKDGSLSTIKVLASPDKSLCEDAIKVVSASPLWSPGMKNKEAVRVKLLLHVRHYSQH